MRGAARVRGPLLPVALLLVLGAVPGAARAQAAGAPAPERPRQDIYYIWREGGRIAQGENPYAAILAGDDTLENRKYPTHLPLFYLAVAATHRLGLTDYARWLYAWRVVLRVFYAGIAVLLFVACRRVGRPVLAVFAVLLWCFNRWTLYVIGVSQIDFVPLFCLLLSLLLLDRAPRAAWLLLGASLATKHLAAPVVPLYLVWAGAGASRAARGGAVLRAAAWIAAIPVAVSLPFLAWHPEAFVRALLFSVARAADSHVSARSADALLGLVGIPARLPMAILMALVYVAAARRQVGRYLAVLLVLTVFVDFNAVLFLQYMAWVVPFLVLPACDQPQAPRPRPGAAGAGDAGGAPAGSAPV